jgi:hypothetical protein
MSSALIENGFHYAGSIARGARACQGRRQFIISPGKMACARQQGNRVLHRHRGKVPEKTVSGPKRSFGPDTVLSGDSSMQYAEDAIALAPQFVETADKR